MKKDPVCLMDVDEREAAVNGLTSDWQGQTLVFCSEQCKQEFDANPEVYATEGREFTMDDESDYTY